MLESYFESQGWTAICEASPHWLALSADLIVTHPHSGWFRIESKYLTPDEGGRKRANRYQHIVFQYRGQKFLDQWITRWALCPYLTCEHTQAGTRNLSSILMTRWSLTLRISRAHSN